MESSWKDPAEGKLMDHAAWSGPMLWAIECLLRDLGYESDNEHVCDTPKRVVAAYAELTSGMKQRPEQVLNASFSDEVYDEIIFVLDVDFVSLCEHHLLPFFGKVHFGYLPHKRIVGLSKIPRMIEVLARRPQVQERLTSQIVDAFQSHVAPKGCGVVVEAWHACASIRGVRKPNMRMRTQAMRGIFLEQPHVKAEFLSSIKGAR